ncbi:hypothetical protein CPB83DRAFT_898089 [Crepidotus variabilis]|uniref:ER-bound oxygenase mpaB/mpaB'/Rubber oxygenase catalytic domain-containing protein n=1 Tax=Crepidotus variabilis TaxID=179855 RepID=A0A9P6E7S7_9AGAR|nr:hypothetical protein CPB83DRAFT_898089 [Crepidotus variabilis]
MPVLSVLPPDFLEQLTSYVTPTRLLVGCLVLWVSAVRAFRWRRYNAIHREYEAKWNNGQGTITPEEAQKICHVSTMYDMPELLNNALAFALFKTYAVPTISKLLVQMKQLSSSNTVSRRYADTEILISTWFTCPISGFHDPQFALKNREMGDDAQPAEDPRAMIALARTNWLHGHYKISNDDYLYTLCLFILEPITWARKYGWRPLSPLEQHSFYTLWAEIGRRMNLQDIPESVEAFQIWGREYEERVMVPTQSNHDTAVHTLNELLAAAPNAFGIKKFGERIAICLLDDIVREAMMYPASPWIYHVIANSLMSSVSFIQRWFMLPRRHPKTHFDTSLGLRFAPGVCPRMHPKKWTAKPWYKPESTGLGYYRDKLLVSIGFYNEMPGAHLKSDGYRLEEVGPAAFENSAHEEVMKNAADLLGCPIAGPWSLEARKGAGI